MNTTYNQSDAAAALDRMRSSYVVMEKCYNSAPDDVFDRARMEYLKARLAYLKYPQH